MSTIPEVTSPNDHAMDLLCERLSGLSNQWKKTSDWPAESLSACSQAGVYKWFLPTESGGFGWNEVDQVRGYLRLSQSDLTTTFVVTQLMGAVRRIAGSENPEPASAWLDSLIAGEAFGTVGISHLTTSRRHLANPVLLATQTANGFTLEGMSPWVTGVPHADVYVVGATMGDGRELLAAVPRALDGITPFPGFDLMALSASCTDRLEFANVQIDESMLIAGPIENVMRTGTGGRTGGLQTSTLAIGLSRAAVEFLKQESNQRSDLKEAAEELDAMICQLEEELLRAAGGDAGCDAADIRGRANRIVLRSTQAALTAAKGAGYVDGHPVGRWCREAMFFLVWSCPQPVAQAYLCELAGIT
ncbi:Acyl-CoA dehydrogenase, short-chain specific [Planctomycetes bacterium CA13]|uniref:Acyl-CoA dehydrogenase, short-chain specific n=1 Tax=Novipirellula herctigrandis TaxID=2527986 RepID=A0A5C5ZAD6_9BACT|nr:Acyl-CoA dehydrogenase, short-chain specific [Planctomycetes bacterium CA13]